MGMVHDEGEVKLGKAALVETDDFIEPLAQLGRVSGGIGDAVAHVVFQELGFQSAERGVDGADGIEDIRAFPVFLDHSPDSLELADDLFHPAHERSALLAVAVHAFTHRGYGYKVKRLFFCGGIRRKGSLHDPLLRGRHFRWIEILAPDRTRAQLGARMGRVFGPAPVDPNDLD